MRYKLLGRSGLRVSELCLGCGTFGVNWGTLGSDQEESRRIQSSDWPSWYLFRRVEIIAAGLAEAIQGWADSWRDGAKKL
jgi:hypothetical protein